MRDPTPSPETLDDSSTAVSDALPQLALDAAELGAWHWQLVRDAIVLDQRAQNLLGLRPAICAAELYAAIQAHDVAEVQSVLARVCDPACADPRFTVGPA